MKRALFFLLFLTTALDTYAITYPQLALGGGYECIVIISNKATESWDGEFRIRTGAGDVWNDPITLNGVDVTGAESAPINLPSNGSKKFVFGGDSEIRAGYLEIHADSPPEILNIAVSFFFNFHQGSKLADSTGVSSAAWSSRFTLPVEKTASVDTGFAWAPSGLVVSPYDVSVVLYDAEGNLFQAKTLSLEGHLARFFSEIFDDVPEGFVGRMTFQSQNGLYLTALRLELVDNGFQLTSVPPE